jgi:TrpR-related protein YerC/YecD
MNRKEIAECFDLPHRRQLLDAIFDCPNRDDLARLLRDLLTLEEIEEVSMRLEVAKLLFTKVPYSQIQTKTKFSSTTIARVSNWLKCGADGYLRAFKRMGF